MGCAGRGSGWRCRGFAPLVAVLVMGVTASCGDTGGSGDGGEAGARTGELAADRPFGLEEPLVVEARLAEGADPYDPVAWRDRAVRRAVRVLVPDGDVAGSELVPVGHPAGGLRFADRPGGTLPRGDYDVHVIRADDGSLWYQAVEGDPALDPKTQMPVDGLGPDNSMGMPVIRRLDVRRGVDEIVVRGAKLGALADDGTLAYTRGVDPYLRPMQSFWPAEIVLRSADGSERVISPRVATWSVHAWVGDRLLVHEGYREGHRSAPTWFWLDRDGTLEALPLGLQFPTEKPVDVTAAPLVAGDGWLLVVTGNGNLLEEHPDGHPYLRLLDPRTGKLSDDAISAGELQRAGLGDPWFRAVAGLGNLALVTGKGRPVVVEVDPEAGRLRLLGSVPLNLGKHEDGSHASLFMVGGKPFVVVHTSEFDLAVRDAMGAIRDGIEVCSLERCVGLTRWKMSPGKIGVTDPFSYSIPNAFWQQGG